jgi:hypothetical protein
MKCTIAIHTQYLFTSSSKTQSTIGGLSIIDGSDHRYVLLHNDKESALSRGIHFGSLIDSRNDLFGVNSIFFFPS